MKVYRRAYRVLILMNLISFVGNITFAIAWGWWYNWLAAGVSASLVIWMMRTPKIFRKGL